MRKDIVLPSAGGGHNHQQTDYIHVLLQFMCCRTFIVDPGHFSSEKKFQLQLLSTKFVFLRSLKIEIGNVQMLMSSQL